jgi:hypothetical protein
MLLEEIYNILEYNKTFPKNQTQAYIRRRGRGLSISLHSNEAKQKHTHQATRRGRLMTLMGNFVEMFLSTRPLPPHSTGLMISRQSAEAVCSA